jgi:hypothetical protein
MEENKFPTETIELPSKGLVYPPGHILRSGKVEMKYMTAREEDILTNQNYIKKGIVLDKLLDSLVMGKFDIKELVIGDKPYQTKLHPVIFNGALTEHFNKPISGNRYSLVYFISAPADATDEEIVKLHNKIISV